MAIERRERLHDVQIMAHGPRLGGQYVVELIDWDTGKDAPMPGTGVLMPPQAIALDSGDAGRAWQEVRDLLDLALIAGANEARAEVERLAQQRDRARRERDAIAVEIDTLKHRLAAAENAARRGVALAAEVARGT